MDVHHKSASVFSSLSFLNVTLASGGPARCWTKQAFRGKNLVSAVVFIFMLMRIMMPFLCMWVRLKKIKTISAVNWHWALMPPVWTKPLFYLWALISPVFHLNVSHSLYLFASSILLFCLLTPPKQNLNQFIQCATLSRFTAQFCETVGESTAVHETEATIFLCTFSYGFHCSLEYLEFEVFWSTVSVMYVGQCLRLCRLRQLELTSTWNQTLHCLILLISKKRSC